MAKHKLRIGFVGLSLNAYFAERHQIRQRSIEGLHRLSALWDFELVAYDDAVTSDEEAVRAANALQDRQLDFLLVQNSSISIGGQFLPLVGLAPRLGIWSLPDPAHQGEVQLHSFVAMSEHASILKRYLKAEAIPFKWFYDHVDTAMFQERFRITVQALRALTHLEKAHIGWIGGVSPGFHNMLVEPSALHERLGLHVGEHDMQMLVSRAQTYADADVEALAASIRSAASAVTVSSSQAFNRVTRVYLALRDIVQENGYDALAVQCWSSIQALYRIVPCMAYSWLGSEDGVAVACEGDLQGAVSMYLLNVLSGSPQSSTLLDMAALDSASQAMMMFHCGVTPRHFANQDGIRWVDHVTLGRNSGEAAYGVAGDHVFAPQKSTTITYLGDAGTRLLVLRASITDHPSPGFDGTRGWFNHFALNDVPIEPLDLINTLTVRGHEHHFAVGIGDFTHALMEFAAWKGLDLIQPVPYAPYLQLEGVNA